MEFYKIEKPTTKQIFDAIIGLEYTPLESIKPKAKQIECLLKDYWNANEILVTFKGVTNSGSVPIFLCDKCSLHDVASEDDNWYNLTQEEQDHEIELLGIYLRPYSYLFYTPKTN